MELITYNRPRPAVVLDVDGVLLPCAELGVERWNNEHPGEVPMTIEEITGYGVIGKRTDEILPYYGEEDFYKAQKPYEGAQGFVKKLSEFCDVYFLTAVPDNVVKLRSQQLKKFFPQVAKDHIFFGSVKERFVADFSLDDCPDHILAQYDSGAVKHPVIMRRPWNESLSGIMSVSDYDDFLTFIKLFINLGTFIEPKIIPGSKVLALVGPAGSEKGKLLTTLLSLGFNRIPSYTTSEKRADEPAGYTHITTEEFRRMKAEGKFIESTSYCNHYYGIPKENILEHNDQNMITVVDICGAVTLKRLYGDRCITVFVNRNEDAVLSDLVDKHTGKDLKDRLRWLNAERKNKELCDICVYNEDPEAAARALIELVK